ncbi:hypothetical protein ONZ51_g10967 [Trametes cubensis]|uniref:Uncharacterized protein n=1 Tax=Trametes cubensis TaxID=1111947 RepID=A0AAD7TJJ0_9APHY|nr:hypothetical protein ONZ51_g10967 [Trametes cubensis]
MDIPRAAQDGFVTILEQPALRIVLLSFLTPRALLLLSRTSSKVREHVLAYMKNAFDINRTLRRFLPDPIEFRCLQARTGTLVSGQVALQFFDRSNYFLPCLDIYVHPMYRREIGEWLLRQGFTFFPGPGQHQSFSSAVLRRQRPAHCKQYPGVLNIFTFYRQIRGVPVQVHIVVALRTPIEVILGFHATCMMNVISYNKAYCLFPYATLEEHISFHCAAPSQPAPSQPAWVSAVPPTFTLVDMPRYDPLPTSRRHRLYPHAPRWLGDSHTWTVPLDMRQILPPIQPNPYCPLRTQDPVGLSGFSLQYNTINRSILVQFSVITSAALHLPFAVGDKDMANHLAHVLQEKATREEYEVTFCGLEDWT